jgi:hypothetical protein
VRSPVAPKITSVQAGGGLILCSFVIQQPAW